MIQKKYVLFLQFVRLGIGVSNEAANVNVADWKSLMTLANKQGLTAIVLDGIDKLPESCRPPKELLLQWIGRVMNDESFYDIRWKSACELAILFAKNKIRTYVLKGMVVSECYPNPMHRLSADLDCYLSSLDNAEVWEKGNLLVENAGFEVNREFYKNSTFLLPGLIVENHKYLTPFRGNKRLTALELLLQDLLLKDEGIDQFEGTDLYRPPVMVSALFLIEHAYSHFLHEGINWRHILDWMMFCRKHKKEINWAQLSQWIDKYGFRKFYDSYMCLGQYLLSEIQADALTDKDKLMLEDVWNDLDLHETVNGVRGKLALAGNTWRARWKYKEFTDISWFKALWIQVKGFLFIKEPKLKI